MKGSTSNRVGQTDTLGQPLAPGSSSTIGDATDAIIRAGFIRKVYGILAVQLMVTFGEVALFTFVDPLRALICAPPFQLGARNADVNQPNLANFQASHPHCVGGEPGSLFIQPNATALGLMYGSWAASFVLIIALACCISNARIYPRNMILLSLFTLAQGTMLGVMCAFYDASSIIMATGMTAIVVLTLTAFARWTTIDFTGMGIYLYVCLIVFILTGFIAGLFVTTLKGFQTLQLLYAAGGVLLFSCYLVYDTQLIVGGKHAKFQFSVDDYVFAALNLYLDIVNLFIYILQILNQR
jgi:FtsH-binding integral membrane protein